MKTSLLSLMCCATVALQPSSASAEPLQPFFYREKAYGSDALFNPLSSALAHALDTVQVPASFDDDDLDEDFQEVFDNLRDPFAAIDKSGGFKDFVNSQIFPIDFDEFDESKETLPNYALHLLGGGMVYRKNAEWFAAHGYAYPRLYSAVLGMAAEFVQEGIEKSSTEPDDEVADFYLFRPLGMLLFNFDKVARFAAEDLRLVEWAYQGTYLIGDGRFANIGQNFAARPALFRNEDHLPFAYFGLTTLFGTSHRVQGEDFFSWGIGAAVERSDPVELRLSGGLFYDRDDSLLASAIINGTEELALRLNIYPGVIPLGEWKLGVFFALQDNGKPPILGLSLAPLPLGPSVELGS